MISANHQDQRVLEETINIGFNEKSQNVCGMKILLVDDSPANFKVLQKILSELKVKIAEALSGEGALKSYLADSPDLILIDVNMFGVDGYDICRLIRANNNSNPIPIIFLTSTINTANIIKDMSFGAVDYIFKPFAPETVLRQTYNQLALRKYTSKNNR
jgi:CheY-like chemotaxis protein